MQPLPFTRFAFAREKEKKKTVTRWTFSFLLTSAVCHASSSSLMPKQSFALLVILRHLAIQFASIEEEKTGRKCKNNARRHERIETIISDSFCGARDGG